MKEAKGVGRNAAKTEFQFGRDSDAGSKLTQSWRRGTIRRANAGCRLLRIV